MKILRSLRHIPKEAHYDEMPSPVGKLTIIASSALHAILWETDREHLDREDFLKDFNHAKNETIHNTKQQLKEYFSGQRRMFDLPLTIYGTEFQLQVWHELIKIPYASTISYGQQAANIGNKNKARAVGITNGLNPVPIIIPCHRVIGSNGKLVGFAGGIDKKVFLLDLEQRQSIDPS